jgi:hypothetical protein
VREGPDLIRRGEGAGLQAWHRSSFWTAARRPQSPHWLEL